MYCFSSATCKGENPARRVRKCVAIIATTDATSGYAKQESMQVHGHYCRCHDWICQAGEYASVFDLLLFHRKQFQRLLTKQGLKFKLNTKVL